MALCKQLVIFILVSAGCFVSWRLIVSSIEKWERGQFWGYVISYALGMNVLLGCVFILWLSAD
jgi:hypothetical protein